MVELIQSPGWPTRHHHLERQVLWFCRDFTPDPSYIPRKGSCAGFEPDVERKDEKWQAGCPSLFTLRWKPESIPLLWPVPWWGIPAIYFHLSCPFCMPLSLLISFSFLRWCLPGFLRPICSFIHECTFKSFHGAYHKLSFRHDSSHVLTHRIHLLKNIGSIICLWNLPACFICCSDHKAWLA